MTSCAEDSREVEVSSADTIEPRDFGNGEFSPEALWAAEKFIFSEASKLDRQREIHAAHFHEYARSIKEVMHYWPEFGPHDIFHEPIHAVSETWNPEWFNNYLEEQLFKRSHTLPKRPACLEAPKIDFESIKAIPGYSLEKTEDKPDGEIGYIFLVDEMVRMDWAHDLYDAMIDRAVLPPCEWLNLALISRDILDYWNNDRLRNFPVLDLPPERRAITDRQISHRINAAMSTARRISAVRRQLSTTPRRNIPPRSDEAAA